MPWARWLVCLVGVFELAYRPALWYATDKEYLFLSVPLLAFNGFVHYRLQRDRAVTWRWLFFLSGMDIALITAAVIIGGDFHLFSYVTYYPALALFAVVFASLWLSLAWATLAGAIYAVVSLAVGPGLDFDAGQEKALLFRVVAMYAVVASVSLIARFERVRRQESAERERELLRERIELSQAIHDTAAQTAYMIGLGIRKAMKLAGGSNEELTATLAATASLSKAAIWELRRPIDEGHLFEGRELGRVLWSHTETFARVASVPAEMLQSGTEMSSMTRIKVMLADDHPIMRDGLRDALEGEGGFEVVGVAADGVEAVSMAQSVAPAVIVMDVMMPHKDGVDACREIMELLPDTRVLMLTASTTEDAVVEAIAAGATGYLQKDSGPEELAEAIREVAQGRLRIPDKSIRRVFALIRGQRGLTASRALKALTVRNSIYRIQDKAGVHSKQELVVWAVRNGLLDEAPAGVDSLPVPEGQ